MDLLPFENIKREVYIKKDAKTNEKFGYYYDKRPIDVLIRYGIVNLDKPPGPTSHQVSAYLQKILNVKKAGHSGTLDPKVSGVLPIALENATKITNLLLTSGKEYIAIMHLHKDIDHSVLYKVCNEFVGEIKQLPPVKSAVKRRWRTRKIYYLKILEIDGRDILIKVGCEAGTYIRKLIHDIGLRLGCGAHMSELRRTKSGPFNENKNLVTLQDVEDAMYYYNKHKNEKFLRYCIQPVENAIEHIPKIWVLDSAVDPLCHGVVLNIPGISKIESGIKPNDIVAVLTLKNELICYGRALMSTEEIMKREKGVALKVERVFMKPNTYPRYIKKA